MVSEWILEELRATGLKTIMGDPTHVSLANKWNTCKLFIFNNLYEYLIY